jgi:serpin B
MNRSLAPGEPIPVFRADHPFLFLIQDNDTGNILFMGRMVNPADV